MKSEQAYDTSLSDRELGWRRIVELVQKKLMLELLLALNSNVPDCPNYWVNPNTFKTECLYSNDGRLTTAPPQAVGRELVFQDDRSAFYIDRSTFKWNGRTVSFTLMDRYVQPSNGIIGLNFGTKVDCNNRTYAISYFEVVGARGSTGITYAKDKFKSLGNNDEYTRQLINTVCR
jgi:hypothetical protein